VLTPLRAAVPRMGPERERVRKQRQSAQGGGRSPPARSDRPRWFRLLCRLSYVVGKVQRRLSAP
jgi:hypothetical protein